MESCKQTALASTVQHDPIKDCSYQQAIVVDMRIEFAVLRPRLPTYPFQLALTNDHGNIDCAGCSDCICKAMIKRHAPLAA